MTEAEQELKKYNIFLLMNMSTNWQSIVPDDLWSESSSSELDEEIDDSLFEISEWQNKYLTSQNFEAIAKARKKGFLEPSEFYRLAQLIVLSEKWLNKDQICELNNFLQRIYLKIYR